MMVVMDDRGWCMMMLMMKCGMDPLLLSHAITQKGVKHLVISATAV